MKFGDFTGHYDKFGNEIKIESSKLLLPDNREAVLKFDKGQLEAYYAEFKTGHVLIDLEGVNNAMSFYLNECIVMD